MNKDDFVKVITAPAIGERGQIAQVISEGRYEVLMTDGTARLYDETSLELVPKSNDFTKFLEHFHANPLNFSLISDETPPQPQEPIKFYQPQEGDTITLLEDQEPKIRTPRNYFQPQQTITITHQRLADLIAEGYMNGFNEAVQKITSELRAAGILPPPDKTPEG